MSGKPSPLKSPTWTLTQLTEVLHVAHKEVVKLVPVDRPVHHWPYCKARPVMSAIPSWLKSATCTSTQVTPVLQVAHRELVKPAPVD